MSQIQVTSFVYSPMRQGYDANSWRTLTGSPAAVSGRLQVDPNGTGQGGAAVHYADILKGDISFNVRLSNAPGSGANSIIGLYSPNSEAYAVFTIAGSGLTCDIQTRRNGAASHSTVLEWNPLWTNANTDFNIVWEAGLVKFYINETKVYAASTGAPVGPLSLYLFDNSTVPHGMSVGNISVRGSQSIVFNDASTDETVTSSAVVMSEKITIADVPSLRIPILVPFITDALSISDVPTVVRI